MFFDIFLLIISSALVNNFVLTQFLGLCPFFGASNKIETAVGMSLATSFVLTLASILSYFINQFILLPYNLEYLTTISFIFSIALVVQFTEILLKMTNPILHKVLGIFLPLITTNCAVLAVALINLNKNHSLIESTFYGLGAALGFSLILIVFASLKERLISPQIPKPFVGSAIFFITAAIMSVAFMGFSGVYS